METIGCGTAIVTPFKADGSVDEPALWSLVNWQIESGIDFHCGVRFDGRSGDAGRGRVAAHGSAGD